MKLSVFTKNVLYPLILNIFIPSATSRIMSDPSESTSPLMNSLINIIKSCHTNNESPLLVVGQFNSRDIELLNDTKSIILLNDINNLDDMKTEILNNNTLQTMILSINNSPDDSKDYFLKIQNKLLRNPRYNIIFNQFEATSCKDAVKYLKLAWQIDLLNIIFLCSHFEKTIKVYTFNPYIQWAPKPWKFIQKHIFQGRYNNTNWNNLYIQEYPASIVCNNLFFDKTLRIDEYKGIRAVTYIPRDKKKVIEFDAHYNIRKQFDISMAKILYTKLNTSFNYTYSTKWGTFNRDGSSFGIDQYIVKKHYDFLLDYRFLVDTNNSVESTSILGESGITFISHKRDNVSILLQIVGFFKPIILLFSLIVLGLTIATLKTSINENFDTATIDVVRLFFNGPLLKVPKSTPSRIFLFTIFIFILVMQSILRSKLLSFIMSPKSDNLDYFADLENYFGNDSIHCKNGYDYLIPDNLQRLCISDKTDNKFYENLTDVSVGENNYNLGFAHYHKMHHSKEIKGKHCIVYRARKNWPLLSRVSDIYTRVFESGLSEINMKWAKRKIRGNCTTNEYRTTKDRRALNLNDLLFAFKILIYGLGCSFICFLIEIKCWRCFFYNPISKQSNIIKTKTLGNV